MSRNEELLAKLLAGETADIVPQSRNEELLLALMKGETPTGEPQSRMEALLQAVCEKGLGSGSGSGGSGGGTSDNVIWVGGSTSSGVANSVVGNGIIRYVTFKNHDGTVEYGRKSVIVGEDCVDPVAAGHMATPTRESTAQYNYTFSGGWATAPNGGKDANALKAVTEDRTVYANFVAAVRYYTITFYDSDGSTVLTTKSLAYGSMPSHTAEKDGFVFDAWVPELATVTGNASYVASWSENITFADATWADIVRVADAGEAQKYFALGDERDFSFTAPNGNKINTKVKIVGFDKDTLSDGSGKAAISIMMCTPAFIAPMGASGATSYLWSTCTMRNSLQGTVLSSFPTALKNGIKSVKKVTRKYVDGTATNGLDTSNDKVWIPSARELGLTSNQTAVSIYPESTSEGGFTYSSVDKNAIIAASSGVNIILSRSAATKNFMTFLAAYQNNSSRYWTTYSGSADTIILIGFCI